MISEFSKCTLYYMKENAKDDKPFTLNAYMRGRVEMWDNIIVLA